MSDQTIPPALEAEIRACAIEDAKAELQATFPHIDHWNDDMIADTVVFRVRESAIRRWIARHPAGAAVDVKVVRCVFAEGMKDSYLAYLPNEFADLFCADVDSLALTDEEFAREHNEAERGAREAVDKFADALDAPRTAPAPEEE